MADTRSYKDKDRDRSLVPGSEVISEEIKLIDNTKFDSYQKRCQKKNRSCMILASSSKKTVCVSKSPLTQEMHCYDERVICCVGNVDAGKSSVLGYLITGEKDDGRGLSRQVIMNYPHEKATGRTSSIGYHILGYDANNMLINHQQYSESKTISWEQVIEAKPTKLISLVDLCGHEKYLKTTVRGIAGEAPDYAMVIVAANDGLLRMTKEHLTLLLQFDIPFCFVVTKIDLPGIDKKLKETYLQIKNFLRRCRKFGELIRNYHSLYKVRKDESILQRTVPIFPVSNVTGTGMDLLQSFIGLLPKRSTIKLSNSDPVKAVISNKYKVKGIGTVVLCRLTSGKFKVGDVLKIGLINMKYISTRVKSIQRRRAPVDVAEAGQVVTVALHNIAVNLIRRGMILTNYPVDKTKDSCKELDCKELEGLACWEFETKMRMVAECTASIRKGYEPTVNVGFVRQNCRVTDVKCQSSDDNKIMRVKDYGFVRFRFIARPEHISVGDVVVVREGRLRAAGRITKLIK